MNLQGLRRHGRRGVVLPVLLAMLWGTPATAFQFNFGDVDGSLDSTISYGMSWRVEDRDKDIIGRANGGNAYSVNGDDGNLNYDDDKLISQTAKITSDLELRYKNFGLFVRGSAFYDYENEDRDREHGHERVGEADLEGHEASVRLCVAGDPDLVWSRQVERPGDQAVDALAEATSVEAGLIGLTRVEGRQEDERGEVQDDQPDDGGDQEARRDTALLV